MKAITMKFNLLTMIALLAVTFTFTSCEDEPIRGCTDAAAENYDALAVESDGSCIFARDKTQFRNNLITDPSHTN